MKAVAQHFWNSLGFGISQQCCKCDEYGRSRLLTGWEQRRRVITLEQCTGPLYKLNKGLNERIIILLLFGSVLAQWCINGVVCRVFLGL